MSPDFAIAEPPTQLDLAVAALRRGWVGDKAIVAASGRQNPNGIARDAKAAALKRGLWWQYMVVNETDTGGGCHHRLWTATEQGIPRPHRAWQQGDAVVHLESPTGHKTIFMREAVGRRVQTREHALAGVHNEDGPCRASETRSPADIMSHIGPRPKEPEAQGRLIG